MTLTQKFLEFDFTLATGSFQGSTGGSGNSCIVTGLRASAEIVKAGGNSLGAADLAIYGLPLSTMNQLSTYGNVLTTQGRNSVTVKAWETGQSPSVVYQGDIISATFDGQGQPDVAFRVQAQVAGQANAKPVTPTSQPGSQSVATLMQAVAGKAGLQFENNGVNVQVRNPYLGGTAIQQMHDLVEMAGIEHIVDNGTLAIWPAGQARTAAGKTIISPQTGLVSYPLFDSQGIIVRTLWQPTLAYGQTITVQSSIPAACKDWTIYKLAYNLASMEEHGPWFCDVWAWNPQLAPTAPVA